MIVELIPIAKEVLEPSDQQHRTKTKADQGKTFQEVTAEVVKPML